MQTAHVLDHAREMDNSSHAWEYAMAVARGVGCDDPHGTARGCTALWYRGKLFSLEISDHYAQMDPVLAGRVINAVIVQAQRAWQDSFDRALARFEGV